MAWVVAGLVVVLVAAVAVAGFVAWKLERRRGAEAVTAINATYRFQRDQAKLIERALSERPAPVVVPAPDLTPYFEQLGRISLGMARELAQGISLIVQGPPTPAGSAAGQGEEAPDNPELEPEPIWYPPWERDETWGIDDGAREDGEWSAHTGTDAPLHDGTGTYTLDGTGAPKRSDGQPMFGGAGIWPKDEAS